MRRFKRERWIPDNAQIIENEYGVAYLYPSQYRGKPAVAVIGYGGKRSDPDLHYSYPNEEQARKAADGFLTRLAAAAEAKAGRQAKRTEHITGLKPGDVLYTSWGYDQTNVEWFQVVGVNPSGKTVTVREIAGKMTEHDGSMSGRSMPAVGQFVGELMTKRPFPCSWTGDVSREYITIDDVRTAYIWDGQPKHVSWYG